MNKNVKLVFDRRKTAEKTGTGFIDICVYLKAGEHKYEIVATATPEDWETISLGKEIQAKVKHYEQIINAMQILGEEMTIANFNNHVFASEVKGSKNDDNKHMYKGTDLRQSFVKFVEEYLSHLKQ